jgi:hypothetical protein
LNTRVKGFGPTPSKGLALIAPVLRVALFPNVSFPIFSHAELRLEESKRMISFNTFALLAVERTSYLSR